jgi:hypothetical protein
VSIYERATGKPAKQPTTNRISGEIGGPLMRFIVIAAADAFAKHPMSPNAIKLRLRRFMGGKGRRAKILSPGNPVQSTNGANISPVTLKRGDNGEAQAKHRRRHRSPIGSPGGADRGRS